MQYPPAFEVSVGCPMCKCTLPVPWAWLGHEGYGGERLGVTGEEVLRAFLAHDGGAQHPHTLDGKLCVQIRCTECGALIDTHAEQHRTNSGWLLTVSGNEMGSGMLRHVETAHP